MQKKLMAAAVAGAFVAPGMAMAQNPSTVQIFGTIYMEYSWAIQGSQGNGNALTNAAAPQGGGMYTGGRPNVDQLQTPGSEIGFKGEEKLGGSLSAWFQCISTADYRGQSGNGWCQRNSAIGFKGAWGNIFAGNWDTPFKRTVDMGRVGGADTGIFGTAFVLTGNSSTVDGRATPWSFKRRQNNQITYESPSWAGFQVLGAMSVPSSNNTIASGVTSAVPGNKPRVYSLGLSYVNGPLAVSGGYEAHKGFSTTEAQLTGTTATFRAGDTKDYGWHLSAAYTFFGALKVGGSYVQRDIDVVSSGVNSNLAINQIGNMKIKSWMLGADWAISGPWGVRGNWTYADDTSGNFGGVVAGGACTNTLVGNAVLNCGQGGTAASLYQIQGYHKFSKRTELALGYVYLDNDSNARYALGGLTNAPQAGAQQSAWAMSVRHTF